VAQKAKRAAMLLWAGSIFLIMGAACLVIDRASAHFFYEHVIDGFFRFADRTTHLAKGSHWLTAAIVVYLAAETGMHFRSGNPGLHIAAKTSLAFLACLTAGSAVLHIVKRILARRRPRDELEMGLYGFIPFSLDAQYNSFPSGHALTITCVAVVATCVLPKLAILWFAIALWLSLTRALLTAHYLSDVFAGALIALLASRETLLYFFPGFAPSWF
jgi:membrane-associated phospholipid phosphatase